MQPISSRTQFEWLESRRGATPDMCLRCCSFMYVVYHFRSQHRPSLAVLYPPASESSAIVLTINEQYRGSNLQRNHSRIMVFMWVCAGWYFSVTYLWHALDSTRFDCRYLSGGSVPDESDVDCVGLAWNTITVTQCRQF